MLLKLKDYERIYKVINSVIRNEGADPSISCLFFSAYGSYILRHHYKLEAHPRAGLASYHVGGNNDALLFAEESEGQITGYLDAFHCWVEVEGWVIDFMAPAFKDIKELQCKIPSLMFQKRASEMVGSLTELRKKGDFYLESTIESTAKHMKVLGTKKAYQDLAEICVQWYSKPPKKIHPFIGIEDQNGKRNKVSLAGYSVVGAW